VGKGEESTGEVPRMVKVFLPFIISALGAILMFDDIEVRI
jgi:hypothetical protein